MIGVGIPLAIGAAAAWAIGMTIAKPGIRQMDRLSYMIARWTLVALLTLAYGAIRGTLLFDDAWAVGMAALAGVLDAAAGGFFFLMAMQRTSAYRATTLASTAPLWGVFASVLLLGERLRWQAAAAAVLVVLGSMLLVERRSWDVESPWGPLFALLTGLLWGVAETVPSKLSLNAGIHPEALLLVFAAAGIAGILFVSPFLRRRIPRHITPRGLLYVSISAAGGAFLGWLLWLYGLELAPASVLSPIRGSTLLFAFVYSVLFLRERPPSRAVLGVLLVLGGVLLVSFAT